MMPVAAALDRTHRIERALERAVVRATPRHSPPILSVALQYAVFPGGARLRPRLCLVAAQANGDPHPRLSDRAAAAVELLHSASLVHDDLPCFDDASQRRGKPSVHARFGESTALLVGDQLIVQSLAEVARAPRMVAVLAGAARALVAGQAFEEAERHAVGSVDIDAYHRAKTGGLFGASAALGAIAAGADPAPWRAFGLALGCAYQVADDLADVLGDPLALGKPVGRDVMLARPSVVGRNGVDDSRRRLRSLLEVANSLAPADAARSFVHQLSASAMGG